MEKGTHLTLLLDIAQLITNLYEIIYVILGILKLTLCPDIDQHLLDDLANKVCQNRITLLGVLLFNEVQLFSGEDLGLVREGVFLRKERGLLDDVALGLVENGVQQGHKVLDVCQH